MEFQGKYKKDGFDFGKARERILNHCKFHVGERFVLSDLLPEESRKQRNFFEGAVIPMWVYLDGKDYKDSATCKDYHEVAKLEFNPKTVIVRGKARVIGGSTKGKLQREEIVDKVIDMLEEQYGIDRVLVLNPADYKHWRDTLRSFKDVPFNYIEYLISMKKLSTVFDRHQPINSLK